MSVALKHFLAAAITLLVGAQFNLASATVDAPPTTTPPEKSATVESEPKTTCQDAPVAAPVPLRHGIFRFDSYPAAWTAAQSTNRPILVFVTSPSCPHCTRMLGESYQLPTVKQIVSGSFETVYVDRVEQPALATALKVRWYPTTVLVAPNNKVIDVIEGYVDPATFSRRLQTTLAAQATATQTR